MKLGVTLDILNQKDTPAFYADTLANRPAAGFTGRVFISTDTLDLYRDTGTTWVLLSPSSTGTITGSGAAGQVTYFSAASSITGSNNLFWDATNNRLGINTNSPAHPLDVHSSVSTSVTLNSTSVGQDNRIAFQNSGVANWRIGNFYNLGLNDFEIYDALLNLPRISVKSTTGQVVIGTTTPSSGLLVVNTSTSDNHIVAIGGNAPSIRVRNAGTAPTLQFGLGLATATNNFIQGSASGDFCIFNSSTTASPILFGVYDAGAGNTQEAARISASRNLLVGTTTDNGSKLQISGTSTFSSSLTITAAASTLFMSLRGRSADNFGFIGFYNNTGSTRYGYIQSHSANGGQLNITADGGAQIIGDSRGLLLQPSSGFVGINATNLQANLVIGGAISGSDVSMELYSEASGTGIQSYNRNTSAYGYFRIITNGETARFTPSANVLIGTTTDAGQKLQVNGETAFTNTSIQLNLVYSGATKTTFRCDSAGGLLVNANASSYIINYIGGTERLRIKTNTINISNIPTSAAGLSSGDIYSNAGILTIVP